MIRTMKTTFLFLVVLSAFSFFSANAESRPDFIPPTPPVSKLIANYTVADVMGIISTDVDQIPANHPFIIDKEYSKSIKKNWAGAKISTNIDVMMQIVLDAPEVAELESPLKRQINGAWANVAYFIYNIMDIPDSDKVDAILRTVNGQTDSSKKFYAINFARMQFANFLDPRLLALELPNLDDATIHTHIYRAAETRPPESYSARSLSKRIILGELSDVMEIDRTPFEVADEAAACAALKAWWTANLPLITTKCAEKKASPNWVRRSFFGKPWDVKW